MKPAATNARNGYGDKIFLAAIAAMRRRHGEVFVIAFFAFATPLRSLREILINMHEMKWS